MCTDSQLHPTLCHPMGCSSPGSSVYGILQARILEWLVISFSRGSASPRDRTCVSCIGRQILYHQRHLGSPHSCPLLMKSTLSRGGGSVGMSMAASTINTWMEMVARQQPEESSSSLPQVLHIMVLYSILEVGQLSMKCW